jgi:cystathionine beta-lyase
VTTALDNTWGAGVAFNPFDLGGVDAGLGADIAVHALTKYPSGGGDVLMGSVTTRDSALHARLSQAHMRSGLGVAGNDAELVLRSLPTLALRYAAHDAAARDLARWCVGRPFVTHVLHPALEGAPGHAHWADCCTAAAGLFSIVLDPDLPASKVDAFVDALRLFRLGFSWGGPVSLVVPYDPAALRSPAPYRGTVVRFSVGLEAIENLKHDLAQALLQLA